MMNGNDGDSDLKGSSSEDDVSMVAGNVVGARRTAEPVPSNLL